VFHVKHYDVIVVGGGHAGVEAAAAAARMGAQTALVTLRADAIGVMSCNPAIGGLGKGHLVREIDALDGIMARAADQAGIHFRLLNRRKGPAVQGPRTQADRKLYRLAVQALVGAQKGLAVVEAEVADLIVQGERVAGVVLADGSQITATSVVITAGTFLNGLIHIGDTSWAAGRMGDEPSLPLAARLREIAPRQGRLKTGTPPRLDGRTIDWDVLEKQPGDDVPEMLSFLSKVPTARQIACGITRTNTATHDIVRKNLDRSAMYGGHIDGVGPRYCPSIEDKVVRFPEKTEHQIFLEPEGLDDHTIYPNGISTSLPADVQADYVRSIHGLENAVILQPGYAIEYDFFDPTGLRPGFETKAVKGLYFAGQINGTTGYEEAAAQGLVAGSSAAAAALGREAAQFTRQNSYIGVMIDDLLTKGVTEPYRMFTSRAEFRLSLRADNADQRLTPLGIGLGLVGPARSAAFDAKLEKLDAGRAILTQHHYGPQQAEAVGLQAGRDGARRSAFQYLGMLGEQPETVRLLCAQASAIDDETLVQLAREALYDQYTRRQTQEAAALDRDSGLLIPDSLDYATLGGLSAEVRAKLQQRRPASLAHARAMEGMTPAATVVLLAHLRRLNRDVSAA
jgi:tRNA uridine 5-carboxymethylaminomethyl modification enzyme